MPCARRLHASRRRSVSLTFSPFPLRPPAPRPPEPGRARAAVRHRAGAGPRRGRPSAQRRGHAQRHLQSPPPVGHAGAGHGCDGVGTGGCMAGDADAIGWGAWLPVTETLLTNLVMAALEQLQYEPVRRPCPGGHRGCDGGVSIARGGADDHDCRTRVCGSTRCASCGSTSTASARRCGWGGRLGLCSAHPLASLPPRVSRAGRGDAAAHRLLRRPARARRRAAVAHG